MTRNEISALVRNPEFVPFVMIAGDGSRFPINHPDFLLLPPVPEEEDPEFASYVIAFPKAGHPRFVVLSNIQAIEFKPIRAA